MKRYDYGIVEKTKEGKYEHWNGIIQTDGGVKYQVSPTQSWKDADTANKRIYLIDDETLEHRNLYLYDFKNKKMIKPITKETKREPLSDNEDNYSSDDILNALKIIQEGLFKENISSEVSTAELKVMDLYHFLENEGESLDMYTAWLFAKYLRQVLLERRDAKNKISMASFLRNHKLGKAIKHKEMEKHYNLRILPEELRTNPEKFFKENIIKEESN